MYQHPSNGYQTETPLPTSTYQGAVEAAVPRELSMDEIPRLRQDYARQLEML